MRGPHDKPVFAKKSFGQNFLVDQNYIDKILDAVAPSSDDTVIEIGPGRGALTASLVASAGKVIAIELDRDMIAVLKEQFTSLTHFQLIAQDALAVDFKTLSEQNDSRKFKLVANLPYYISTAILQKLIDERAAFSKMVLMFQKEVVDRILATPGTSERGFLTVIVEAGFSIQRLFSVPPNAFRPVPKVDSAVVRLTPKPAYERPELFRSIVSAGFAQKRKTILNNLKLLFPNADRILADAAIDSRRRAETLELAEWHRLTAAAHANE